LKRAGQTTFTKQLLKQQLKHFRKIARLPDEHFLKELTFIPDSLRPATDWYVRRVGRPRSEWASKLQFHSFDNSGAAPFNPIGRLIKQKFGL